MKVKNAITTGLISLVAIGSSVIIGGEPAKAGVRVSGCVDNVCIDVGDGYSKSYIKRSKKYRYYDDDPYYHDGYKRIKRRYRRVGYRHNKRFKDYYYWHNNRRYFHNTSGVLFIID